MDTDVNIIQASPEPTPEETKQTVKNHTSRYLVVVILILVGVIGGLLFYIAKPKQPDQRVTDHTTSPSPTQTTVANQQTKPEIKSNFFLTQLPKPIANLTVNDLPNSMEPRAVVEVDNHVWFTGYGSIVEADTTTGQTIAYSDPTKGICTGIIAVNSYLYASCRMKDVKEYEQYYTNDTEDAHYAILKINPKTHNLERVFTPNDGLKNSTNYQLYADGNTLWVATLNGVGKIDTTSDKVSFYAQELGISGTVLDIRMMMVDKDYVWAHISASSYSPGGFSMYNKKDNSWTAFNVKDLKEYDYSRIDLESGKNGWAMKTVPGGIRLGFRDGNYPDGTDRFVEKEYQYDTKKWTKITEKGATGDRAKESQDYINTQYSQNTEYWFEDEAGFTQLRSPSTNKVIPVNARNNYQLSPIIGNKRYVLTSASIDVIDDTSPFPQVYVKMNRRFSDGLSADPSGFAGPLLLHIDPESLVAVVTDCACGGMGYSNPTVPKIHIIDLKTGQIKKQLFEKDTIPSGESLIDSSMNRENNILIIKDKNKVPIFSVDPSNFTFTNLFHPTPTPTPSSN